MFGLGMQEMIIVGIVALLLFGKRLPDVARSVGKSYTEFRRGLSDIQSQMNMADMYTSTSSSSYASSSVTENCDDYDVATAPKFEPPAALPAPEASAAASAGFTVPPESLSSPPAPEAPPAA